MNTNTIDHKKEIFITKSRYSTCYRSGTIFRKYFNYPVPEYIEREMKYSNIAYNFGLLTPKFLNYGYSSYYDKPYIDFEYLDFETFFSRNDYSYTAIQKVFDIACKMNDIKPVQSDNFWNENRMSDFLKTLKIANKVVSGSTENDMSLLAKLPCNNVIHGDLTETNVCFYGKDIYIVDFETACIGPKLWDKCYFLASVFTRNIPNYVSSLITEEELKITQIITKIRYGRAIRKNLRVDERASCCKIWCSLRIK